MSSSFTALPLESGEAFLLQTVCDGKEWTILVDSGTRYKHKPHPLVCAVEKAVPKLKTIDVAICTHQDADHANGFRTFADAWCSKGREISEFWLPGRWASVVPEVLFDPVGLAVRLWRGAYAAAEHLASEESRGSDEAERERPARQTIEQRLRNAAPVSEIDEYFWPVSLLNSNGTLKSIHLSQSLGVDKRDLQNLRRGLEEVERTNDNLLRVRTTAEDIFHPLWWLVDGGVSLRAYALFRDVIEAAESISAIAKGAISWCIPIRWFDFGLFEQYRKSLGGIENFLKPICAVELSKPPPRISDQVLFYSLYLSLQNVESLIFLRVETRDEPGVLFTGDSRLTFGVDKPTCDFVMPSKRPNRRIIVTAPHHGSQVNDEAYRVIEDWLGNNAPKPIYVRNGGQRNQTMGVFGQQAFKSCARCFKCSTRDLLRRVRVRSTCGCWRLDKRSAPPCP